jgi:uncharacterized protein YukE
VVRIGGDIGGLRAVAASLTGVVGDVANTGEYLSKRVDQLVNDAGWSGAAAEEFKGAWEQDATAVVELSGDIKIVGTILASLADGLEAAQRRLDQAAATARANGMPFSSDGFPIDGPYTGQAATAAAQFGLDTRAAYTAAQDARDLAVEELHDIVAAIAGEDTTYLKPADAATLAASLKGYYALPNELSADAKADLAAFNRRYADTRYLRKHAPAGSKAKADLTADLQQMRADRKLLQTDVTAAEKLAGHFKGGRILGSSVGDLADSLGLLEDGSKLSRLLDGLPVVDVALGGIATWAQAKEDHQKGWSWTHAIIADGGSNVAAIGAGLATDAIPVVGPFLAPVVAYGVGSWTYEASHEGHWTEHIHEDGVIDGTAEGLWDTTTATWDNDMYGMYKKLDNDIHHPADAAKSLWHGVTSLF